jgi:hypothetical protein
MDCDIKCSDNFSQFSSVSVCKSTDDIPVRLQLLATKPSTICHSSDTLKFNAVHPAEFWSSRGQRELWYTKRRMLECTYNVHSFSSLSYDRSKALPTSWRHIWAVKARLHSFLTSTIEWKQSQYPLNRLGGSQGRSGRFGQGRQRTYNETMRAFLQQML